MFLPLSGIFPFFFFYFLLPWYIYFLCELSAITVARVYNSLLSFLRNLRIFNLLLVLLTAAVFFSVLGKLLLSIMYMNYRAVDFILIYFLYIALRLLARYDYSLQIIS